MAGFHSKQIDANVHALTAAPAYASRAARDADTAFQVASNINKASKGFGVGGKKVRS